MDRDEYQRNYRQQYKDQARRVNLTFSLSEVSELEEAAKSSGKPLSAFVKELALQAFANERALPDAVEELLADHERLVRNIANNVNQMARHSNRLEQVVDEQEVLLHLRLLDEQLRKTLRSLDGTKERAQ